MTGTVGYRTFLMVTVTEVEKLIITINFIIGPFLTRVGIGSGVWE